MTLRLQEIALNQPLFMPSPAPREPLHVVRTSKIHGTGVFAARNIRKNQKILEYRGEKISKEESERRGLGLMDRAKQDGSAAVYIFTLDDDWDLDGDLPENDARLINHSCEPNCEAWIKQNRIWIHALHAIKEGEELTFNYGFALETWEDHPCHCGTDRCVGYIVSEALWPDLAREIAFRAEAARTKAASRRARASRPSVTRGPVH